MKNLGILRGAIDNNFGPQTQQALCAFRRMAGLPVSRGPLTLADSAALQAASTLSSIRQLPAARVNGNSTYLYADMTCQAMLYAKNGHYERVFPISTGTAKDEKGKDRRTPQGSYTLGGYIFPLEDGRKSTLGWHCSSLYPEGCTDHTEGQYARRHANGNMYNSRFFSPGYFVHGSTSVPTYPASHGCVRISVADADWMAANMPHPIHLEVRGAYA